MCARFLSGCMMFGRLLGIDLPIWTGIRIIVINPGSLLNQYISLKRFQDRDDGEMV